MEEVEQELAGAAEDKVTATVEAALGVDDAEDGSLKKELVVQAEESVGSFVEDKLGLGGGDDGGDDGGVQIELASDQMSPIDYDPDKQETPRCCELECAKEHKNYCRFSLFYFMLFIAVSTGIQFVEFKYGSDQSEDYMGNFDTLENLFDGISAILAFFFCIYLANLSDLKGRKRYIVYTTIVVTIPFILMLFIDSVYIYFGFFAFSGAVAGWVITSQSVLTIMMTLYLIDSLPQKC